MPALLLTLLPILVAQFVSIVKTIRAKWPKWAWVLDEAARYAVLATEQAKKAGIIDKAAAVAKEYALGIAKQFMAAHNIKGIDVDLIYAANEAALWQYINSVKAGQVTPTTSTIQGSGA